MDNDRPPIYGDFSKKEISQEAEVIVFYPQLRKLPQPKEMHEISSLI